MYGFEALTFNIHGGYLEAIARGHRAGLLTAADYNNLCQCETLDDVKMHLSATEYGPYLQNEPSPLHTTTIVEKCTLKLVEEYNHMLCQAVEPLSTFLEYIRYGHMIDNVVLIVTGTLHERDVQELLEKCHPLGMFDSIASLAVAQNMRELYRLVLVDTPLAPYFSECITSEDLDDMNIEIMRNTLYKAYLEDFYRFCLKLGGATAEVMSGLLAFEADRRAVNITINSIGTELTREDRKKLYSDFGLLYPYGHEELAVCEDIDQVHDHTVVVVVVIIIITKAMKFITEYHSFHYYRIDHSCRFFLKFNIILVLFYVIPHFQTFIMIHRCYTISPTSSSLIVFLY
nr:V-type proton ATPase subunit D2 [Ipomoea batatas]